MSGAEMLYNWRLGFDFIMSGSAPGFTDTQVYSILNRAQDAVIRKAVEERDILSINTILKDKYSAAGGGTYKVYSMPVPGDYWMYYTSYSTLDRTAIPNTGFIPGYEMIVAGSKTIENEYIESNQATNFLPSAFNTVKIFEKPKAYLKGVSLYVVADDYTTIAFITMQYVKKRVDISGSVSCELPEIKHRDVVNTAIDLAKTILNAQTPQSNKES